jgi:hypothetical protein
VEDRPGQASRLQDILSRLSTLERENAELKASNLKLREDLNLVRKEVSGWTLDSQDHPAAQQLTEKFQAERELILQGVTVILQDAFGVAVDADSQDL